MPTISQRGTRGRARVFALGFALATLIAAPVHLTASPALAGPDDSKYVATEGHVDSPKVFWNGTTFELKSEHGQPRPLEDTVNYLGKGYNAEGQTWLFTVPENEPALDFLGKAGTTWFQAPQIAGWGNQPIWSGFGADAGVPAEQFRDALFTLDIVKAEGPGQVEWFAWQESSSSATRVPERFFSTKGTQAQSQSLQPGTHTHNFTLFEKPGRYNITYRATARAKDGTIIASEDTSLAWQVGGARPGSLTAPAASTEAPSSASNYRFTIAPAPADKVDARDAANTAKLSLGTLELGAAVNGTAEVFIDGHHFTDLAVTNGHAEFVDFLGDDAAKFQLRFTPSSGSAAPSWTSSPIDYASGRPEVTTTGTSDAELMTPIDATTEGDFPTVSYTPVRPATMNAGLKPGVGTDTFSVNVAIDDPKVFGFLDVIHYEPGNDRPSSTYTYWIPGGANVDARVEFASYMAGGKIVARFRPHPLIGTEVTETVLSNAYKVGETTTTTATIKPRADGSSPAPTATPTPTPPSQDQCSDRVLLDHGHIDMASAVLDGSTLKMFVKDDTRIAASGSVDRDASDVAIVASDASKFTRDARQSGAAWDRVLAPIGQENYLLPMTQVNDLPWPGYSTERVDHSRLDGPLTLSLTNVRGPGEFAMFQADTFGGNPKEILGSRDGAPTTISIASSTHAHAAWSFTKAGVYELDLRYTGKLKDGTVLDSGVKTIRFAVGSAGKSELCASEATATPESPAATGTTSPTPTDETPAGAPQPAEATPDSAQAAASASPHAGSTSASPHANVQSADARGHGTLASTGVDVFATLPIAGMLAVLALALTCAALHRDRRDEA